jgi:spore maturation protein CgeB
MHSTSRHRAEALRRIGCKVNLLNPKNAYSHLRLHQKINNLSGYCLVNPMVHRWLLRQTSGKQYDVVWVDGGHAVPRNSIHHFQGLGAKVLNYAIDDPTGNRDGNSWWTVRRALPEYDLGVAVRGESEQEFHNLGVKSVLRVWRSYDEVAHAPYPSTELISNSFRSEVAFIGTWMRGEKCEGRDNFLFKLAEAGIPIAIWGGRWHKSPYWLKLKPFWRGESLAGRDYVAAIQGAKITLGFLSRGNRDLHTTRSSEITYAGGLLCAKRTSEHLQMYQDGVEAVFWSSVEECILKCRDLLTDETRRAQIRLAGKKRICDLGLGNETICRRILVELGYAQFQNNITPKMFRMCDVK